MSHQHEVYDDDLRFIIDPVTRDIHSENGKVRLMQMDHNSERFTFEIPRYVEEHDMTLCNVIEVHYVNKGGINKRNESRDVYPVTDFQVSTIDPDVAIGSWLISQNATKYYGDLEFNIRFACVNDDGEIEYQWFTNQYSETEIEQSIYNVDVVTQNGDPDTLVVWKEEISKTVSGIIDGTVAEAEDYANKAEIFASNAEDYANNARVSETNAATYMQNAATSEQNAKTSEQNAATSEQNAKTSEENAKESETEAKTASEDASTYATRSESYAKGGTGSRLDENTDNAKYYSEAAKTLCEEALSRIDVCDKTLADINKAASGATFSVNYDTGELIYDSANYAFHVNSETGNLEWEAT